MNIWRAFRHDWSLTPDVVRKHLVDRCERCRCLFEPSKDHRLVQAVARQELGISVLLLCPTGEGRPKSYPSIMDTPLEHDCSCGQTHHVLLSDLEITFHTKPPANSLGNASEQPENRVPAQNRPKQA